MTSVILASQTCSWSVSLTCFQPVIDVSPQKNARAPLSAVFDGKSALEHMHYAILIQVIRHHGLGNLLDRPNGQVFRKMLAAIVLATDMGVHFKFMQDFGLLVEGRDYPLSRRKLLVCQALIKCADISNPVSLRDILRAASLTLCARVDRQAYRIIGQMR